MGCSSTSGRTSEWKDKSKGTTPLTQAEIVKVLGCTEEVFNAAIYAGQEKMPDLPGMTDKALKAIIEEAAGSDILERAYAIARDKLNNAKRQLELDEARVTAEESTLKTIQEQKIDLYKQQGAWLKKREADLETGAGEVRMLMARVKGTQAGIDAADEPAVLAKIAELDAKIAGTDAERETEKALADAHTKLDKDIAGKTSLLKARKRDIRAQKKSWTRSLRWSARIAGSVARPTANTTWKPPGRRVGATSRRCSLI